MLVDGIYWEWRNDDNVNWVAYPPDVSAYIEINYKKRAQKTTVDLSIKFPNQPYIIDLAQMTQARKQTGRLREIRRREGAAYQQLDPPNMVIIFTYLSKGSCAPLTLLVPTLRL